MAGKGYDAYNESICLIKAVERYKTRTGHYPEWVLADQIYRRRVTELTVKNMAYDYQDQSLTDHQWMPK